MQLPLSDVTSTPPSFLVEIYLRRESIVVTNRDGKPGARDYYRLTGEERRGVHLDAGEWRFELCIFEGTFLAFFAFAESDILAALSRKRDKGSPCNAGYVNPP